MRTLADAARSTFPRVFISYRRDDTAGHAGHLYADLVAQFGADRVFMDTETIEPGADFTERLRREIESCDVLLALIGKQWLRRRLHEQADYVRLEIQSALDRKMRVIPVLLQGARMPSVAQLPESIGDLSHRNALEISNSRWRHDVETLVGALQGREQLEPGTRYRTNLPLQLTSFVGRQREIEDIDQKFSSGRLVTLTGTGGAGKTRLALQAAASRQAQHPDGVWLLDLAPVAGADAALLPHVVAASFGIPDQGARPVGDVLIDYFQGRRMLLIFDNCEQIVDACASLIESLLRFCPGLFVLATSRERLGVEGEALLRILPFDVPSDQGAGAPTAVIRSEAVQLFSERAASVMGAFSPSDLDVSRVVQICRRVDGIPLAIELAASRLSVLSLEQIAVGLDDRFRILARGRRTAPQRHQTMKATLDWSHGLLSDSEQVLFRRLAVFAGDFTFEAAEGICAADSLESATVFESLARLVDKSLLAVDTSQRAAAYRLLETVRQYALDRLEEAGEVDALRNRHLDWYVALAERAAVELQGPDQELWLSRLDHELDNLRATLLWGSSIGGLQPLRLAYALRRFWTIRGFFREARQHLDNALRTSTEPSPARAWALLQAGHLATFEGHEEARERLSEALTLHEQFGDLSGVSQTLMNLSMLAFDSGTDSEAMAMAERSLEMSRKIGDAWELAAALNNIGLYGHLAGDQGSQAQDRLEESLRLARETKDIRLLASILDSLATIASDHGELAKAHSYLQELGGIVSTHQSDRWQVCSLLDGFGKLAAAEGKPDTALRLFAAAAQLLSEMGASVPRAEQASIDQILVGAREAAGAIKAEAAWREGTAMSAAEAIDYALGARPTDGTAVSR